MTTEAIELGARAEAAVVQYLRGQGYQIVATNLRLGRLELDIVARLESTVAVVEVRTRGKHAWTRPFGSIDTKKRQRIRQAGERLWQRRYRNDPSVARMRFDAAAVTFDAGEPTIDYVPAAF